MQCKMCRPRMILVIALLLTGLESIVADKNDNKDDDDGQPDYCPEPDGMFPNPTDCASFYNCVGGTPIIMSCAPGLLFDPESKMCNFPDQVKCSNECRGQSGLFPSQHRCDEFVLCNNNEPKVMRCKKGLYFDAGLQVCNYKNSVLCTLPGGGKKGKKGKGDDNKGGNDKGGSNKNDNNKGNKGGSGNDHNNNKGGNSGGNGGNYNNQGGGGGGGYNGNGGGNNHGNGRNQNGGGSTNFFHQSRQGHAQLAAASVRSVCPKSRGLFAHAEDCDMFYQCWDGEVQVRSCPAGLLFDEDELTCSYPRHVYCGKRRFPKHRNLS